MYDDFPQHAIILSLWYDTSQHFPSGTTDHVQKSTYLNKSGE